MKFTESFARVQDFSCLFLKDARCSGMKILSIDPGPLVCCYTILDGKNFVDCGVVFSEIAAETLPEIAKENKCSIAIEELTAIAIKGRLTTLPGCYETLEVIGGIFAMGKFKGVKIIKVNRIRHVLQLFFKTSDVTWELLERLGLATMQEVNDAWREHMIKLKEKKTTSKEPRPKKDDCVKRWLGKNYAFFDVAEINFKMARRGHHYNRLGDLYSSLAINITAQNPEFIAARNALWESNKAKAEAAKQRKKRSERIPRNPLAPDVGAFN